MKKGCFVISQDFFSESDISSNGVNKKSISQLKVLNEYTGNCKLLNFSKNL